MSPGSGLALIGATAPLFALCNVLPYSSFNQNMLMAEPSTYDMFAFLKKNRYVDDEPSTYVMVSVSLK